MNTQPFSQIGKMIGLCCESLSVRCIWLHVIIMSRTSFRVNQHSTAQLNYFVTLTKWFSVHLQTKWLCVRIPLLSLKLQIWRPLWGRSSLTFRQTVECRFSLKLVCDMIIAYSQMHRSDKYSQHSSIIWPVWLNGWHSGKL